MDYNNQKLALNNGKKTVLIADDDTDYLQQLKLHIESFGFNTLTASDDQECINLMNQLRPDLAIFDLMMNNDDSGFILSYKMKRLYPDVPIAILTSASSVTGINFESEMYSDQSWIKADRYLTKGIRADQLHMEINKLLKV